MLGFQARNCGVQPLCMCTTSTPLDWVFSTAGKVASPPSLLKPKIDILIVLTKTVLHQFLVLLFFFLVYSEIILNGIFH